MEDKKKGLCIIIIVLLVLAGICGGYFWYKNSHKDRPSGSSTEVDASKYISIGINGKKVLRKDLNITDNAKITSSKIDKNSNIVFLDVIEPDFQFETHYLFCFNADGKLIFDGRDFRDKDNDNNRYKYNGKFDYDESKKVLSFYTSLFLGESDESTGTAFNDKFISNLTKEEKNKLGNYSDVVKYEYKYEDNKVTFSKKEEVSKLKDNAYHKNILSN